MVGDRVVEVPHRDVAWLRRDVEDATGRRPSVARSRPARSRLVSVSSRPAAAIRSRTASPWSWPCRARPAIRAKVSRTQVVDDPQIVEAAGPAKSADTGSQSLTMCSRSTEASATYSGLKTMTSDRASSGSGWNQRPSATITLTRRSTQPHEIAACDGNSLGRDIGDPDGPVPSCGARRPSPNRSHPSRCRGRRRGGRARRFRPLDRDLGHEFRFRAPDQHPCVDRRVDPTKPPTAQDVLDRLARLAAATIAWRWATARSVAGRSSIDTELVGLVDVAVPQTHGASVGSRAAQSSPASGSRQVTVCPSPAPAVDVSHASPFEPSASSRARSSAASASTTMPRSPPGVGGPVHGEADPVIGDPVLLEVVGPDLLAAPTTADLGRRSIDSSAARSASARSNRRARSTCIARFRFWSWSVRPAW